jgi:DNA-binding transcriptional LysR family regulator
MKNIHKGRFDLNLLRTLAVLLEERQVSRAATRLNLTQSAVSHALGRLRRQFDDPLLVRRGQLMVPTPRAERLGEQLQGVLSAVSEMVGPDDFDPAEATGTIRIAATDYGSAIVLPHAVRRLAEEAPRLSVSYTDLQDETFDHLRTGFIDLALSGQESHRDMQTEVLFQERFVIMVRPGHPCLDRRMTVDEYVAWPHIVVDLVHSRLLAIDRVLERLGRKRTIGIRLPHFLAAPFLAQRSDLLVPVPERMAALYASALGLVTVEHPRELEVERFDYVQMWDARRERDPLHAWLRSLIRDSARQLDPPEGRPLDR